MTRGTGAYGTIGYGYDKNGNRLSQTKAGANFSYTYGSGNRLAAVKQGNATVRSFTYAANGNITRDTSAAATLNLTYNRADQLSAVTKSGQTSTYRYDAFGQRRSAVVTGLGTTVFQYDLAGNLIEEVTGTRRFDTIYFDGRPVARLEVSTGNLAFLHDDRLGTPQLATNSAQAVVWRASYQPFGTTTPTGTLNQPFRFPGQFADPTGYFHNGFRDYDPTLGRYLQSDPIGLAGGLNTYAYVSSNPLRGIDPLGLSEFGPSIGDLSPLSNSPLSAKSEEVGTPESYLPERRPADPSRKDAIKPDGSSDLCPPTEDERRKIEKIKQDREWTLDEPSRMKKYEDEARARRKDRKVEEARDRYRESRNPEYAELLRKLARIRDDIASYRPDFARGRGG